MLIGAWKRGWGSGRGGLTKLMYHTLDHPIFGFWLDLSTPTLQLYFSYIYIYIIYNEPRNEYNSTLLLLADSSTQFQEWK